MTALLVVGVSKLKERKKRLTIKLLSLAARSKPLLL